VHGERGDCCALALNIHMLTKRGCACDTACRPSPIEPGSIRESLGRSRRERKMRRIVVQQLRNQPRQRRPAKLRLGV